MPTKPATSSSRPCSATSRCRAAMRTKLTRRLRNFALEADAVRLLRLRARIQRQRLVAEHGLDDDVAGFVGIERVLRDQVAAFGNDLVGVLHHLEVLVAIFPLQSHALTDDFENVDDAERPVALVRAEFARLGMIDRTESV